MQDPRQPVRQRIDDGDFKAEPPVVDRGGKVVAVLKQRSGARRKLVQAIEQRRAGALGAERFHMVPLAASASCGT